MNCDGRVDDTDYTDYFLPKLLSQSAPGPSGLDCAGHFPCPSCTSPGCDPDGDLAQNFSDNCTEVSNEEQCDTDRDGYGNDCDADFDGSGQVDAADRSYLALDLASGRDGGRGTDLNCDGTVDDLDVHRFEALEGRGPGPSGLSCAGTYPCD
jgi:hypothetical protein